MLAFLRRFTRILLVIAGFVLIALFIWFAGPLFEFADYRPFESTAVRLYLIAAVFVVWLVIRLIKRLRAFKASDNLVAAVLKQAVPAKAAPTAEQLKLRERFEEAAATLKQKRRGGHSLYELPWYVIIGAPGSGKTTALINSGLKFPLEPRGGRALKGVGGTRNCDWWFAEEAVFLDTAGRYTTQDSDAASDSEGWAEFLALLRKYRKRRPINGVILTISTHDLIVQSDIQREEHVEAARRRLLELNRELRIQLPVYVMVTKCDLVAGFTEYFDDLSHEARAQVWGVTFPYEYTRSGDAPDRFSSEFDALMERLNERVTARVEEERDVRRRTRLFAFPQQMAALRDPLTAFISDVFATSSFEQQVLLRGVYLTSGTQEGTPIDRLLGAMIGRYGLSAEAVAPPAGRGKAYFVERLLKDVLIGESGLAGTDRRGEVAKAALHLAAYAAAALIATLGVTGLTVSYRNNRQYLTRVAADLDTFNKVPPVGVKAPPDRILTRLNAIRTLSDSANLHTGNVPWSMRWGLYQGAAIGTEAVEAYRRELDNLLLPQVTTRFGERVKQHLADPERQLDALKAYLMLDDPQHLDREFLEKRGEAEWGQGGPSSNPNSPTFATHLQTRLAMEAELPRRSLDQALIAKARGALQQASIAGIVYKEIERQYAEDPASAARAVSLDRAGTGAGLIRRKSGISLSQSLPSLFSKPVFNEVTDAGSSFDLVKRYAADDWVLGGTGGWTGDPTKLRNEVFDRYEREYYSAWDRVLDDLELTQPNSPAEFTRALETLSGPESPLRNLVATVVDNTKLEQPVPAQAPGLIASVKRSAETATKSLQRATGMTPTGRLVTAHFQPYHRLLEGDPGKTPIDRVIFAMARLRTEWDAIVAAGAVARAEESATFRDAKQVLRQESQLLPPSLRLLPDQISSGIDNSIREANGLEKLDKSRREKDAEQQRMTDEQQRMTDIVTMYRQRVLPECNRVVEGRYPFTQGSDNNLPLRDFTNLFGPEGIFENFFKTHLASEVDTASQPWRWQTEAARTHLPAEILRVFENASDVREAFFQGGSKTVNMQYTARLLDFDQSAATRFRIDIEGQGLDSVQRNQDYGLQWPGPKPSHVEVLFDGRWSTPYREVFNGPWAWFRLLERNKLTRESDTRNILTITVQGVQARLAIEASTVHNPFADAYWQRFKCGS